MTMYKILLLKNTLSQSLLPYPSFITFKLFAIALFLFIMLSLEGAEKEATI